MKTIVLSCLFALFTCLSFGQGYQSANNMEEIVLEIDSMEEEATIELGKINAIYRIVAFDSWIENITVKNEMGKVISNVDYSETKGVYLNLKYIQAASYDVFVSTEDGKTKRYTLRN